MAHSAEVEPVSTQLSDGRTSAPRIWCSDWPNQLYQECMTTSLFHHNNNVVLLVGFMTVMGAGRDHSWLSRVQEKITHDGCRKRWNTMKCHLFLLQIPFTLLKFLRLMQGWLPCNSSWRGHWRQLRITPIGKHCLPLFCIFCSSHTHS